MTENYYTEQENFWAGDFGNEYVLRSQGTEILNSNISFFKSALKKYQEHKNLYRIWLKYWNEYKGFTNSFS